MDESAQAVCLLPVAVVNAVADAGGIGAAASGTSGSPASMLNNTTFANDMEIVLTNVSNGAADTWTESAGYTALTPVLNTHALRMAWTIVSGLLPPVYAPINSNTTRNWIVTNVPYRAATCALAATGAGVC